MRVLYIDEDVKNDIRCVVDYAQANFLTLDQVKTRVENGEPIGNDRRFNCMIPDGYKVTFSIEQQSFGWTKHISVSVTDRTKMPNPAAVKLLMQEFDMGYPLVNSLVFIENVNDGVQAINVICPVETGKENWLEEAREKS